MRHDGEMCIRDRAYSARIVDRREMGTKWLGARPANPKLFSLPTITGLIILNDPDTFCPMAVMDCTWITGMRTAGVSGIALRHLVREGNKNKMCIRDRAWE